MFLPQLLKRRHYTPNHNFLIIAVRFAFEFIQLFHDASESLFVHNFLLKQPDVFTELDHVVGRREELAVVGLNVDVLVFLYLLQRHIFVV